MVKDSKSAKKNKQTQKVEAPRKEGGLFWLAVVIILGVLAFVWIVKTYGPKGGGVPDDALVRVVIREQFDAVFAKDLDKFLSYYSTDYDSGIQTFDEKAEMIRQVFDTEFVVRDFVLEFLDSGEDNTDVHFDESRGFASVVVYTYWKQRTGESITRIPLMQLSAFLLRKEGDEWKIISDNSQGLNKKEALIAFQAVYRSQDIRLAPAEDNRGTSGAASRERATVRNGHRRNPVGSRHVGRITMWSC